MAREREGIHPPPLSSELAAAKDARGRDKEKEVIRTEPEVGMAFLRARVEGKRSTRALSFTKRGSEKREVGAKKERGRRVVFFLSFLFFSFFLLPSLFALLSFYFGASEREKKLGALFLTLVTFFILPSFLIHLLTSYLSLFLVRNKPVLPRSSRQRSNPLDFGLACRQWAAPRIGVEVWSSAEGDVGRKPFLRSLATSSITLPSLSLLSTSTFDLNSLSLRS